MLLAPLRPAGRPWSWSRATSPSTPSATELACTSSPPARPNVNGTSDTKSGAGRRGPCGTGCWTGWADAAVHAGLGLWALDGRAPEGVLVLTVAATTGALLSLAGGRPGATTCARAGAGVAAGRPGRAPAAGRCGRGPGRTSALSLGLRVLSSAARRLATRAGGVSRPGWEVPSGVRLPCAVAIPARSDRWPAR
jgi:hypothetical protein